MAQAIDVMFRYGCGRLRLDRRFEDMQEAVRYALETADAVGWDRDGIPPSVVLVVEGDTTMLAIRVFFGGLIPADARSPAAMSPATGPTPSPSATARP